MTYKANVYTQELNPTLKGPLTIFRLNQILADCSATLPKVSLTEQAIVHEVLGTCQLHLGKLNEALSHYNKAYNIDPGRRSSYGNGALAMFFLGRTQDALDRYAKLASDNPGDINAITGMAANLTMMGQLEDAYAAFETAAELARTAMDHFRVAVAAADMELHVEACEMFARAIAIELHRPLGDARAIDFISAASEETKGCLRYLGAEALLASIERMTVDGDELLAYHQAMKTLPKDTGSSPEALIEAQRVLESMAPFRARANRATLGVSENGQL